MDLFVVIRHYQRSRSCFPFLSLVICLSSAGDSQWTQAGTIDLYMHLTSAYLALICIHKLRVGKTSRNASTYLVRFSVEDIYKYTSIDTIDFGTALNPLFSQFLTRAGCVQDINDSRDSAIHI